MSDQVLEKSIKNYSKLPSTNRVDIRDSIAALDGLEMLLFSKLDDEIINKQHDEYFKACCILTNIRRIMLTSIHIQSTLILDDNIWLCLLKLSPKRWRTEEWFSLIQQCKVDPEFRGDINMKEVVSRLKEVELRCMSSYEGCEAYNVDTLVYLTIALRNFRFASSYFLLTRSLTAFSSIRFDCIKSMSETVSLRAMSFTVLCAYATIVSSATTLQKIEDKVKCKVAYAKDMAGIAIGPVTPLL